jgi:predicted RNA-binding protein with PUA domain
MSGLDWIRPTMESVPELVGEDSRRRNKELMEDGCYDVKPDESRHPNHLSTRGVKILMHNMPEGTGAFLKRKMEAEVTNGQVVANRLHMKKYERWGIVDENWRVTPLGWAVAYLF